MTALDIREIIKCLPHRAPFLLVDKVLDYKDNEFIVAVKNITFNESYFVGHFPKRPVMPGVLIIEAMAQATGVLAFKTWGGTRPNDLCFLAGVDEVRFKRIVEPGDQLHITVTVLRSKHHVWKVKGVASVDGEVACSGVLIIMRGVSE